MKKSIFLLITLIISIQSIGQCIYEIGFYPINGVMAISAIDNYMILSNGDIVDISDPANPNLISQYSYNGDGTSIIIDNNYAYFGTGMTNDLFIADISNITFPIHKSSIDFTIGNGVFGMDISENTLFVALGTDGIVCSIDITDNNNPIVLDTLIMSGGQCRDVVTQNDYAFAAHDGGLKVLDISNPSDMQFITSIGSGYNSLDLNNNFVFMGKSSGGVDVYDISEPTNPAPAFAIVNSFGRVWDIKYQENLLYLATNSYGLFIYKIEDNNATEMARFASYGQSFGVCPHDSLVFLPGLVLGVSVLQYDSLGNVGISPILVNKRIKLFPNPAKYFITINNDNVEIKEFEITNLYGVTVLKQEFNSNEKSIDISDLPAGQYLITFKTDTGLISEKLIKTE